MRLPCLVDSSCSILLRRIAYTAYSCQVDGATYRAYPGGVRNEICSAVGARIRHYRENAAMTQIQLGERLGLKDPSARVEIYRYEEGKRLPSLERLYALAHALDIPPSSLIDDGVRANNPKRKAPKRSKGKKSKTAKSKTAKSKTAKTTKTRKRKNAKKKNR